MELPSDFYSKGKEKYVPQQLRRIPISEQMILELGHSFRKQYGMPDEWLTLAEALVIFQYVLKASKTSLPHFFFLLFLALPAQQRCFLLRKTFSSTKRIRMYLFFHAKTTSLRSLEMWGECQFLP